MLYLWIKYIHILSSTIVFGTGIGTAAVMVYGHLYQDIAVKVAIYRYVVIADWIFTSTSGFVQLISGLALVYIANIPITTFWILGGLIGYSITAICWFIVVYLQIKIKQIAEVTYATGKPLSVTYYRYFYLWFFLGWPAFISLLIVFYLMVLKPYSLFGS
ncbi:integral membrane protein (plasmid) [Legionella adelaidensis]|uniref:Integral membrane protein n=2 Tax=Legionella adelaidensis TaxID=45056 RepID=A0A0W0R440_9GAMM|nr:DUF2269 domain-containing protein [Legionella adelaidensis]KTC65827.1 integral membrane protein [Legionella adelaidensis]VEH85257.1 integral membrane protein [Legionella adelaidensis]